MDVYQFLNNFLYQLIIIFISRCITPVMKKNTLYSVCYDYIQLNEINQSDWLVSWIMQNLVVKSTTLYGIPPPVLAIR